MKRKSSKYNILWQYSNGRRRLYAFSVLALFTATALLYIVPLIIMFTIDTLLTPPAPGSISDASDGPGASGGEAAGNGADVSQSTWVDSLIDWVGGTEYLAQNLWIIGLAIVGITALSGWFTYLRGKWSASAAEQITRDIRDGLYNHLQHLPCSYYDNAETGDLVQRCTSDVETVRMFLSTQVVEIARAIIMLAAALPLMFALDVSLTLAAICLLPIIIIFGLIFFIKVKTTFEAADISEGKLTSLLQENLTGVRVVRAFARQKFEIEKFVGRNDDLYDKSMRLYTVLAYYWAISDLLVFIQIGIILSYGAYLMILTPAAGGITAGLMVAFWAYVLMFIWPVRQMGRILSEMGKAIVSLGRIHDILDSPVEARPASKAESLQGVTSLPEKVNGHIRFEDVVFSHAEGSPVLRGVSFEIQPGETIAILGPSGSGKSTIINLLLRFYDVESGRITLDGKDLAVLDRKEVRAKFGVVMQEPFLYSKSLRENLKIGSADVADEHMIEAARAAAVHDAIAEFDDGYDTLIGERGVTLSGGQRQRVALTRALLLEAPILILDDAFSAVDTQTETMIVDALKRRHGRQSTIVIAHRLSSLMHADRIIVLEDGRITQSGSHETLCGVDGLYRNLWELQSSVKQEFMNASASVAGGGGDV